MNIKILHYLIGVSFVGITIFHSTYAVATDYRKLIDDARKSTVFITTDVQAGSTVTTHTGTGFVLSSDGYVLTASHVVPTKQNEQQIKGTFGSLASSKGRLEEMEVIARDPFFDAVLLKFKNTAVFYPSLPIAPRSSLKSGDEIFQTGFPKNMEFNSKTGRVSGLGGPFGSIVTDMVLNPGDSGSPVLTVDGQVGALVVSDLQNALGISFLLPITHINSLLSIAQVDAAHKTDGGITYKIDGEISGIFESAENWSQTFSYSKSDQNCDANYDVTQRFCAPADFNVINPGVVTPKSANCNSSIGSARIASSSCVDVPATLAGCGNDRVFGQIVNCKGRGWVDYELKLDAQKRLTNPADLYGFTEVLAQKDSSNFTAVHPKAGTGGAGRKWLYRVRVIVERNGIQSKVIEATTQLPSPEGIATRMDDGILQVSFLK